MNEQIAANLAVVTQRIADACRRAGRSPDDVLLIAVSKTVAAETIAAAWELGLTDFGENRVQEAREKIPLLHRLPARWHLIGHLQSNKAGHAADLFQMIHSIDSVEIAGFLSKRMGERGKRLPVLLEANVGGEASKSGFSIGGTATDAFMQSARAIVALPGLDVQGLMTVAPQTDEPESVRGCFAGLRGLLERLKAEAPGPDWRHLSMGMSDDFEAAIEEGATMVRLGRAIFGPRPAGP